MVLTVWTRQRTQWHQPRRGWFSLPPGTKGHRVSLETLPNRERAIFRNILLKSPSLVLVHLVQRVRAVSRNLLLEAQTMNDATDLEQAAMAAALPLLGEYVASIGMHRPLAEYSKQEVITMISVVVTAYQDYFSNHNDDIPF